MLFWRRILRLTARSPSPLQESLSIPASRLMVQSRVMVTCQRSPWVGSPLVWSYQAMLRVSIHTSISVSSYVSAGLRDELDIAEIILGSLPD